MDGRVHGRHADTEDTGDLLESAMTTDIPSPQPWGIDATRPVRMRVRRTWGGWMDACLVDVLVGSR